MIFLLVCMLGVLVSMRDGVVHTVATGNNLARQKSVHVADIALRQLEKQIADTYGGVPLQISASGQPWWRNVAPGTAAPAAGYWDACLGHASDAERCGSIAVSVNGTPLPHTAFAIVQPTGRSDSVSCDLAEFTAVFYDVFIHVEESNGATAADTQTVLRLCTAY